MQFDSFPPMLFCRRPAGVNERCKSSNARGASSPLHGAEVTVNWGLCTANRVAFDVKVQCVKLAELFQNF